MNPAEQASQPLVDAMIAEMSEHAEAATALLRAMANPHRLLLLCVLGEQELSVGDLNTFVPLSQSALSQHLARLRSDGLVETRREGQTIYYRVTPGPAQGVLNVLREHFCGPHNPAEEKQS